MSRATGGTRTGGRPANENAATGMVMFGGAAGGGAPAWARRGFAVTSMRATRVTTCHSRRRPSWRLGESDLEQRGTKWSSRHFSVTHTRSNRYFISAPGNWGRAHGSARAGQELAARIVRHAGHGLASRRRDALGRASHASHPMWFRSTSSAPQAASRDPELFADRRRDRLVPRTLRDRRALALARSYRRATQLAGSL